MQLRVRCRVQGGFKQGAENVVDEVLEVGDDALVAVDVVEARDLDEPDDCCVGCLVGLLKERKEE